jgi:hypothetical protein
MACDQRSPAWFVFIAVLFGITQTPLEEPIDLFVGLLSGAVSVAIGHGDPIFVSEQFVDCNGKRWSLSQTSERRPTPHRWVEHDRLIGLICKNRRDQ